MLFGPIPDRRRNTSATSVNSTASSSGNALEELLFSGGSLNRKLLGGKVGEVVEDQPTAAALL
jgi:hypothetical protein